MSVNRVYVSGLTTFAVVTLGAIIAPRAHAEMSDEELAKLTQNPVGNLISIPFQESANLNFGPEHATQNVLNIQPVIPISVTENWNIITRTILPIISLPPLYDGDTRTNGIGDTTFSTFLSPANPGHWIWGAGTALQIPTHSGSRLGNSNTGLGPTAVFLHLEQGSPWVYGALINSIWSIGAKSGPDVPAEQQAYISSLVQPFVNYNFKWGYLSSAPIITINWKADSNSKWTVPVGGVIGHIFHAGKLPLNSQIGAYYNAVHPEDGANWTLRLQVQILLPKTIF